MFHLNRHAATQGPATSDTANYGPRPGIPALTLNDLMLRYAEQVEAVCLRVALPHRLEDGLLRPMIARYASYVHLLPASESTHHCEPGGLLYHGFETAAFAVQFSGGVYFQVPDQSQTERKQSEPRWRVALVGAALAHDLGKPVTDMIVTAEDAGTWNPLETSLTDWISKYNIDRYHYSWREQRADKHKSAGLLLCDPLLGTQCKAWLNEYGGHCIAAILSYLGGDAHGQFAALVSKADEESAKLGIARSHTDAVTGTGHLPLRDRLGAAIRHCVESGQWTVNKAQAQVYVNQERAWLVWPACAKAIGNFLHEVGTPGVDLRAGNIAALLVATGIAEPARDTDGGPDPIWTIWPGEACSGTQGLHTVCISSAALALSTPPSKCQVRLTPSPVPTDRVAPVEAGPEPPLTITPVMQAEPPQVMAHLMGTPRTGESPTTPAKREVHAPRSREAATANVAARVYGTNPEEARAWLEQQGAPGAHLGMLARQLNGGLTSWGQHLEYHDGHIWIVVPEGLPVKVSSHDFQAALDSLAWIEYDPVNPMRRVRDLPGGRRGIALEAKVSQRILAASGGPPQPETAAESNTKTEVNHSP